MRQRLTRRHWMLLAGSGLLAACSGTSQKLVVQQGLVPSAWLRRLPRSWRAESLDWRQSLIYRSFKSYRRNNSTLKR